MVTTLTETAGDEGTTASESPVVRFREVGKVYDDEGLRVIAFNVSSSGAKRSRNPSDRPSTSSA